MIIPLPGETKETYFEGIEFLMEHNIQPGTYTLMMLDGAELGRDAAIKRFGMKGKWRILPKQFGKYNGKKVFETEQACIETNTMSFDDYIECRNYSFILRLISSQSFLPIYKLAKQLNISWFEVSKKLSELVQDKNFKGKLKDIFDGFCKESQNELFETQKEAMDFYEIEENYKKLVSGDIGDNLLGKYSALGLLHINEVISAIFYIMKNKFNIENNEKSKKILESSEKWLKNIYMIDKIFDQDVGNQKKHKIEMNFDFPSWLTEDTKPINSFIKDSVYEFSYDKDKLDYLRRELNIISASTNEIALGKLLLQQAARSFNIFEKQYTKIN